MKFKYIYTFFRDQMCLTFLWKKKRMMFGRRLDFLHWYFQSEKFFSFQNPFIHNSLFDSFPHNCGYIKSSSDFSYSRLFFFYFIFKDLNLYYTIYIYIYRQCVPIYLGQDNFPEVISATGNSTVHHYRKSITTLNWFSYSEWSFLRFTTFLLILKSY